MNATRREHLLILVEQLRQLVTEKPSVLMRITPGCAERFHQFDRTGIETRQCVPLYDNAGIPPPGKLDDGSIHRRRKEKDGF